MANDIVLETEALSKYWGGIKALNDSSCTAWSAPTALARVLC